MARGRLNEDGDRARGHVQVIFRQEPTHTGNNHFGSRLVFDRDGNLFVTLGDRFDLRDQAQNPANHLGKIVHITPDGGPAPNNPFLNREDARPEIWSLGHRNVQAAALNPTTGELWTAEHGARGGDEVNIPAEGQELRLARHLLRRRLFRREDRRGHREGRAWSSRSITGTRPSRPSGMAFYTGDKFPAWRGSILVGALAGKLVSRLETNGNKVTGEERMLQNLGERIRDVRQGPDGFVYLLTDSRRVAFCGCARRIKARRWRERWNLPRALGR